MSACTGAGPGAIHSYWPSQEVPVRVLGLVSFKMPVQMQINAHETSAVPVPVRIQVLAII